MAVYVDNLRQVPRLEGKHWPYGESCHLVADTEEELHDFAAKKVGLNMLWFQKRDVLSHYDLSKNMRGRAVKNGAIEITDKQLVAMMRKEREDSKMRVIIAGSRDITEYTHLLNAFATTGWIPHTILSGGARGADALGEVYAYDNSIDLNIYPAEWDKHGKKAGFIRNKLMAENADALIALWDGESKGTAHMIHAATELGLMVHVEHTKKEREDNTVKENPEHMNNWQKNNREEVANTMPPVQGLPVRAFDVETELISYTNPIPDLICTSFANAGDVRGSIETPWEHDTQATFINAFITGQHHVGHNTCFDLSILAFKYPDLLPHIFDALDRDLIHDTLLREKLLMLTLHGNFEMIEANGCNIRLGYKLTDLEKKYLNIDRSDLKDDEDAPRHNYAMYKNVPLIQWAENFISYSIDDSVNTGLIFMEQEKARARCIETTGYDPFAVETFRVRVSFALRLLECVGSRMDPAMVIEVTKRFRTEYNLPRLRQPLLNTGLLLDVVPAKPYANGALAHTEACDANKDDKEHKKLRKTKTCGCPPKMKASEPEKNPHRPIFQYIWNLAATNPNIQAWPSEKCESTIHKADAHKAMMDGKAFRKEIILSTNIDKALAEHEAKIATVLKKDAKKLTETIAFIKLCIQAGHIVYLPDDIKLATHEEWTTTFASLDPLLAIWAERKALRKIITDYLPKMYYTDENGVETPAEVIRGSFWPMCLTGRSSSSASKFYPSRNQQNVDPRVRPCDIPRDGNLYVSTDYKGMELATLAQKCVTLFGHSVMADNINKGVDNHAYLAAQIAAALDVYFASAVQEAIDKGDRDAIFDIFSGLKKAKTPCDSATFCDNFKAKYRQEQSKELDRPVLWSDFFKYYRLLAKPTGLGFPGGLGAATMVAYAKGTYKVELSLEMAQQLRKVWLETYPEMDQYLKWIKTHCKDPHHAPIEIEDDRGDMKTKTFYSYDTPRGMHRARCGFCETANGTGLQAFSAEGALQALYNVQKAMWLAKEGDPLYGSFPINFLHDEIIWETPGTDKVPASRVKILENIMIDAMEQITPDVKAGTDSVAMRRWYKQAEGIRDEYDNLIPWEPEPEKKGI